MPKRSSAGSESEHSRRDPGIGTNEGEYVSFIISDNREGANGVGKALVAAMKEKGMADGTIGLVTISLTRNKGKKRTAGFRAALEEGGIKECAFEQMQNYTANETFYRGEIIARAMKAEDSEAAAQPQTDSVAKPILIAAGIPKTSN